MAVAWCGDPRRVLPYQRLESFGSSIRATIGISFNQTHPDGIDWLRKIDADVRIFRCEKSKPLFHPKIYLFRKDRAFALFIGSSNLTYSGFYRNVETNLLMEGVMDDCDSPVELIKTLDHWRTDENSFEPTDKWLSAYRKQYQNSIDKARNSGVELPSNEEGEAPVSSWLTQADWSVYCSEIENGLDRRSMNVTEFSDYLAGIEESLPLPWDASIFDELENRKMIGGMAPYGLLGHVAASGKFREFMTNSNFKDARRKSCKIINSIVSMELPLDMSALEKQLNALVALGPTMKVWSRILCVLRPDLFCTVASVSVRVNLGAVLDVPVESFKTPTGYIHLLKIVHNAPWFGVSRPKKSSEARIWDARAAFMDSVFYEE